MLVCRKSLDGTGVDPLFNVRVPKVADPAALAVSSTSYIMPLVLSLTATGLRYRATTLPSKSWCPITDSNREPLDSKSSTSNQLG